MRFSVVALCLAVLAIPVRASAQLVNNVYACVANSTGTPRIVAVGVQPAGWPDGPLFTDFLAKLNSDSSIDGTSICFANHCDWRLPTIVEVQALRLGTSGVCIDAIFGPTQDGNYWSSTSLEGHTDSAWLGQFNYMNPSGKDVLLKTIPLFARAVRSIR